MKTISIKQPWAYLICTPRQDNPQLGIKDIENRTWATNFRGHLLVHASAKRWTFKAIVQYLTSATAEIIRTLGFNAEWVLKLHTSAIIGSVEIVDCVINHPSIWAEKTPGYIKGMNPKFIEKLDGVPVIWNWVLANPVLFAKPITNVKGKLSFWEYGLTEESYLNLISVDANEDFDSLPKIE